MDLHLEMCLAPLAGSARFSNQMLRYQRKPAELVHEIGLPAHRAMPDAYLTAHHLRDMLNEASLDQLIVWSAELGLLPRVPNGPDRGKSWDQLSVEALTELASSRDVDIRFSAHPLKLTEQRVGDEARPIGVDMAVAGRRSRIARA